MARKPRPAPFSLRLTFEQRARLLELAGDQSLGGYILERLFAPEPGPVGRIGARKRDNDWQAVAQLLGKLGQSRLSSNVNQLAKAANTGSLAVTPETEAALNEAADAIREMRRTLIAALNLEPGP